jgi:hypothetical protein
LRPIADECSLIIGMPVQKPFNVEALWKGKIQEAGYPEAKLGPDFWLPKVNILTGVVLNSPDLTKENYKSYSKYSDNYWAGVRERHAAYRASRL